MSVEGVHLDDVRKLVEQLPEHDAEWERYGIDYYVMVESDGRITWCVPIPESIDESFDHIIGRSNVDADEATYKAFCAMADGDVDLCDWGEEHCPEPDDKLLEIHQMQSDLYLMEHDGFRDGDAPLDELFRSYAGVSFDGFYVYEDYVTELAKHCVRIGWFERSAQMYLDNCAKDSQ